MYLWIGLGTKTDQISDVGNAYASLLSAQHESNMCGQLQKKLGGWQFILQWSQPNVGNYMLTIPCGLSSKLLPFASALLRHCLFPHYDGGVYQLGTYNWWRRSCDVACKQNVKAIVSLKNYLHEEDSYELDPLTLSKEKKNM